MGYSDKGSIDGNPGEHGLNLVAEIEYSSGSYEFDTRIVWADKDGKLYTARDSGCSCPSPFEDYKGIEDLDRLDLTDLKAEVNGAWDRSSATTLADKLDFVKKVEDAARNPSKYAFDQADYDLKQANRKERETIGDGLREAARFLKLNPFGIKTHEIVDHVWKARDLTVAQVHTLGVYLANVAGQQRDGE
jgi:hypothetical protein